MKHVKIVNVQLFVFLAIMAIALFMGCAGFDLGSGDDEPSFGSGSNGSTAENDYDASPEPEPARFLFSLTDSSGK